MNFFCKKSSLISKYNILIISVIRSSTWYTNCAHCQSYANEVKRMYCIEACNWCHERILVSTPHPSIVYYNILGGKSSLWVLQCQPHDSCTSYSEGTVLSTYIIIVNILLALVGADVRFLQSCPSYFIIVILSEFTMPYLQASWWSKLYSLRLKETTKACKYYEHFLCK